jgi:O-antigen/teichoic acid export membrane protein/glycosyltransferase involved in cell wall biosynthesis
MSSRVLAPIAPGGLRARLSASLPAFSRDAIVLFVALGLLNGSNYLFNVVVSRLLGPGAYGELAALFAATLVLSVPFGVVQTLAAKHAATLREEGEAAALAAGASKALLPIAVLATLFSLAVSPLIAVFLSSGVGTAALLAPYIGVSLLASVHLGVLQGRLRFGALAGVTLAGVAARLVVGITLVWAGFGVPGALLGTVLAQTVALGLLLPLTLRGLGRRPAPATLAPFRGETVSALVALAAFWLLAELDILLGRHYLNSATSGYYSSAGLLARVLLFLPAALSIVALPRFAAARNNPVLAFRRLSITLYLVAGLATCGFLGLVFLRHFLVDVTFGSSYSPAARLLPLLALGGAALAVVNVLVYYHIALETRAHRLLLAALAGEMVGVGFFHASGTQIALVFVLTTSLAAALQLHAAHAVSRWRRYEGSTETAALADDAPELSVVMPCHNGATELPGVVADIRRHLAGTSYEIVVVSDGSTDSTEQVAAGLGPEVSVVHYPVQVGKGHALRVGLARSVGRYVAFIDADGDIDPATLVPFVELMRLYEPDIVLGSKRHPLSDVHYPILRRLLSWAYQMLARLLFRVGVRDTQTGLKLIRRDVLAAVLPRMLEKRYAFDLELIVVARLLGYRRVLEAPVRLDYRFSSRIDPRATLRIFIDTLAIFYRRYILATYGSPRATRRVDPDRLQILFLSWRDIHNPSAGGAEVWTHQVARCWVEQGHSVTLLTSGFSDGRGHEVIDGVHVRRIGRLRNGTFHVLVQLRLARLSGFDAVIDEINTVPFFTPLWRWRLPATVALIRQQAVDAWEVKLSRPATLVRGLAVWMLRLYRTMPVVAVSESARDDLCAHSLGNADGGRVVAPRSAHLGIKRFESAGSSLSEAVVDEPVAAVATRLLAHANTLRNFGEASASLEIR